MEQEAKNEIKKILEQYRLAYEDLDIQKIRQVFPQAPSALEQYFRQFKGVEYKFTGEIEYIEMNQLLGTAIVKVPVSMVSIGKVGGDQAPAEGRHLFNMERKGSRWFIAKMTFEPKGRS